MVPLYLIAGFGAGSAVLAPIFMVRAFPPDVRFTGVSFSYNVACAVVGGVTPILVSWLAHLDRFNPAHYIAVAGILGVVAPFMSPAREMESTRLAGDAAA